MSVQFTADAEKERMQNKPKPTWELFRSVSIVQAIHFARDNGWAEKKVQVKFERKGTDIIEYVVEPFEKDCNCPSILRYKDYYGTEGTE